MPLPDGQILTYQETSHEFGHRVRHVLDGSFYHWNDDSSFYTYGRSHDFCTTQTGTIANHGFAFNEGWAEYWAGQIHCCPNDINNQTMEGTVAHDLDRLAMCPGSSVGRSGMVRVLERGSRIIHSDVEFRREYALQFPACARTLGNISDGCLPGGPPVAALLTASVLDPGRQRNRLLAAIDAREKALAALRDRQASSTGPVSVLLGAAVEEGSLVVQRMKEELSALDLANPVEGYLQRALPERLRRAEFATRRKQIQIRALQNGLSAASSEQRIALQRRIRLLQESRIEDASLETLFPLPEAAGDDEFTMVAPVISHRAVWSTFAVAVVLAILGATIIYARRNRS